MFNRLFSHKANATDGLTQEQREAIVDVLHFCMFADNFIALSESQFIASEVETLNWDPKISFEYYQGKSIGAVRAALANVDARKKFVESVKQRLHTDQVRGMAFDLCQKLLVADGTETPSEFSAQEEIRQAFGISP